MLAPRSIRTEPIFENDPVKAAEEEIRTYLIKHRVVRPVRIKSDNGRMIICFLGIYATLAFIAVVVSFFVNRIDCDPMFTDRGLTAACRDWSRDLGKVVGTSNGADLSFTQPD